MNRKNATAAVALAACISSTLTIRPGAGFRSLETDQTDEEFRFTDVSVYADWWLSRSWRLFAGVSRTFGDELDTTFAEVGAEFHW